MIIDGSEAARVEKEREKEAWVRKERERSQKDGSDGEQDLPVYADGRSVDGHSGHVNDGLEDRTAEDLATFSSSGHGLHSTAHMRQDGRIGISLALKTQFPALGPGLPPPYVEHEVEELVHAGQLGRVPPLNIVIMIVGSRGDVQPFLAFGQGLKKYGHRVRIATHAPFKDFVHEAGLEFFNIGGDPKDLMSYMVKNPGLMPGYESLTNGDIGRKQAMLSEIMDGCWRSCSQPDETTFRRFSADAIISNPPAFAHIHCAEALGIPLLLSFTMPWCATRAFPHPLVNINQSNAEPALTNYLSYAMADLMTWKGLSGVINKFRTRTLGLDDLTTYSGASLTDRLKIPWTYCFSPELVPKPRDWPSHIDVVGFYFLDLAQNYQPPADLLAFLDAGPPPIYIGFGSVVVEDAAAMTTTIFEAVRRAGVRALVSAGWGGLGGTTIPSNIFILGNIPHDWLFTKVAAVCHHGGAGTTAIGLRLGKPTIVVPFFGDQPFWGSMIHRAGAGPEPIPARQLNVETLTEGIKFVMTPKAGIAAEALGRKIRSQDGVAKGVESFHRHLPLSRMSCDLYPDRLAAWWCEDYSLKLSALAAHALLHVGTLRMRQLVPHRSKDYDSERSVTDPLTGTTMELFRAVTNVTDGVVDLFHKPVKGLRKTAAVIPRATVNMVNTLSTGLSETPKLYGGRIRAVGQVIGFTSGLKEGSKGLAYGIWDGVTGLATEPRRGYREEGAVGLMKGTARSYANLLVLPLAGTLEFVTQPVRGAWKSYKRMKVDVNKDVDRRLALQFYGGVQFNESGLDARDVVTRFHQARQGKGKKFVPPSSQSSLQLEPTKTL